MPALSERASRAHRARRLQQANSTVRELRVTHSASPSRYNSADQDYNAKRSSSIPPTPITYMSTVSEHRYSGSVSPETFASSFPRESAPSIRSRFTDADMEDDMPMDEFQQVVESRLPLSDSIYPPQIVSPINDTSVSSVSSSEEPRVRLGTKPRRPPSPVVTPPRNSAKITRTDSARRSLSSYASGSSVMRDATPRNANANENHDPQHRNALRTASTYGSGRTAQSSPISESRSFDLPPPSSPNYIHHSASDDTADPQQYSRNVSALETVEYPRRHMDGSVGNKNAVLFSVTRLANAIRSRSNRRPDNLSVEEQTLWDAVQHAFSGQRSEMMARRRVLERQLQESTSEVDKLQIQILALRKELDTSVTHLQNTKRELFDAQSVQAQKKNNSSDEQIAQLEAHIEELQQRYDKAIEVTESCQDEHDRAICAIQRVLADVHEQREEQVSELESRIKEFQDKLQQQQDEGNREETNNQSDIAALRARAQRAFHLENEIEELKNAQIRTEEERDQLQHDLDKKNGVIVVLEQELSVVKNALQNARDKEAGFEEVIARQRKQLAEQVTNNFASPESINTPEIESMRNELEEKAKSLENAKALISSLETANGSMVASLRCKLKSKDEQILIFKAEAADRERRMDCLATELKDLQNLNNGSTLSGAKIQENLTLLSQKLTQAVGDLQSALVVLESSGSGECETIDSISLTFCNTISAIKTSVDALQLQEISDLSIGRHLRPINRCVESPPGEVVEKLKKMDVKLKVADAALKKAEGEVAHLKVQNERLRALKSQEESKLKEQIRHLEGEFKLNLESLEKKTQELQVLRDSLEVGDEVGYISGDETDEEDDAQQVSPNPGVATATDTLAKLLARGGMDMADTVNAAELDKMKNELKKVERERQRAKDSLKVERESLANAKMIISSLEKANKTMLEDLRSRLQDSNAAIAALLEKSVISEKAYKDMEEKFKKLAIEKEKADTDHEAEVAKLKSEALITALKMAAKEREIDDVALKADFEKDQDCVNEHKSSE